jgi:WD40 repeat protein/serine/threonine protein kinase
MQRDGNGISSETYPQELCELFQQVQADQRHRWQLGERPTLESYLAQHPELAASPEAVLGLVGHELRLRHEAGIPPTLEEYQRRFPHLADLLRDRFEALTDPAGSSEKTPVLSASRTGPADAWATVNPEASPDATPDLARPPAGTGDDWATVTGEAQPAAAGPQKLPLAGYEILSELGRGGMGVVYKARDRKLRRLVALKMILAGEHAGAREMLRLRGEAEAVARLQHPNIVQIFEIGEADGLPFLALEYCPGGSLASRLQGTPLPPRQAAELLVVLARAIAHAHQSGIIHRDLKPGNILLQKKAEATPKTESVTAETGFSLADYEPKVSDFGLAKRLDQGGSTITGAVLGTPSYMAPEQARGTQEDIGRGADVYALGAILYELLTGRPPFRAASPWDTVQQVLTEEPVPPSEIQSKTPRDLETICLKCLEKTPARRYDSAEDLTADLQRYLNDEPILARRTSRLERLLKWARRRKALAALVVVSFLAATALLILAAISWQRTVELARAVVDMKEAEGRRDRAVSEERAARTGERIARRDEAKAKWVGRRMGYNTDLGRADLAFLGADVIPILAALDRTRPKKDEQDLRGFEWYYLERLCTEAKATFPGQACVAYSDDGRTLATGGPDHTVRLLDGQSGKELRVLAGLDDDLTALTFLGRKQVAAAATDGKVHIWDVTSGETVRQWQAHPGRVNQLAYDPIQAALVSAGADGRVRVWQEGAEKPRLTLTKHIGSVTGIAFSPDGKRLVTTGADRKPRIWEMLHGQEIRLFPVSAVPFATVAYSPDGRRIALAQAAKNGVIQLWKAAPWTPRPEEEIKHKSIVHRIAFSLDGRYLAAACSDYNVWVWDLKPQVDPRTGKEIKGKRAPHILFGHKSDVVGLAFSPDGRHLATVGKDQQVKVWDFRHRAAEQTLSGHAALVGALDFSSDNRLLASGSNDRTVKVWDLTTGKARRAFTGASAWVSSVAFSPDGRRLAATTGNPYSTNSALVREAALLLESALAPMAVGLGSLPSIVTAAQLASPQVPGQLPGGEVFLWDLETGRRLWRIQASDRPLYEVVFHPNGRSLAAAGGGGVLLLWDSETGKLLSRVEDNKGRDINSIAFNPAGNLLASAEADGFVRLRDPQTLRTLRELGKHAKPEATAVIFSPNGKLLASAGEDNLVKIWDVASGKVLHELERHDRRVRGLSFSADGRRLASLGDDRHVVLWDMDLGMAVFTFRIENLAEAVAFSPNGKRLAVSGGPTPTRGEVTVLLGPP